MTYTLNIKACNTFGAIKGDFSTIKEVSEAYCKVRDASNEGVSTFHSGYVKDDKGDEYYISYNGCVWKGRVTDVGMGELVYSPS